MIEEPVIEIEDTAFPRAFFAPHEDQAQRNHCKSITQLAEGVWLISWSEAFAILSDRSWQLIPEDVARPAVEALYEVWRAGRVGQIVKDNFPEPQ